MNNPDDPPPPHQPEDDDMRHTDCANCANCGHSHTYDGPLKPYKPVDTPCWKCCCDDYAKAT